jgi:hypothetical protein
MAKGESKVQKVARGVAVKTKKVFCHCGGKIIPVRWVPWVGKGRIIQVCENNLGATDPSVCARPPKA